MPFCGGLRGYSIYISIISWKSIKSINSKYTQCINNLQYIVQLKWDWHMPCAHISVLFIKTIFMCYCTNLYNWYTFCSFLLHRKSKKINLNILWILCSIRTVLNYLCNFINKRHNVSNRIYKVALAQFYTVIVLLLNLEMNIYLTFTLF